VDDGSTDPSLAVINQFGDQVRLVAKENGGQASAFNAGFAESKGEIILLFWTQDDLFVADKVENWYRSFSSSRKWAGVLTSYTCSRKTAERTPRRFADWKPGLLDVRQGTMAGKPPIWRRQRRALSFRRDTLAQILPMPEVIRDYQR